MILISQPSYKKDLLSTPFLKQKRKIMCFYVYLANSYELMIHFFVYRARRISILELNLQLSYE